MQLLRFDARTGKAQPIDLTGSKLNFRIYKPCYDFEVSLKHEATGKEYRRTITLTQDESAMLTGMTSQEDRQTYALNLRATQTALQELVSEAGLPSVAEKP